MVELEALILAVMSITLGVPVGVEGLVVADGLMVADGLAAELDGLGRTEGFEGLEGNAEPDPDGAGCDTEAPADDGLPTEGAG